MGDVLARLFVNIESLPHDGYGFVQVMFLGACYLYILLIGANMIGDGSELLMLIPSIAGVVGSVVLPVLGAVPDGAIVLFSGLGPADKAQQQVSVGVGALAGSTVMLLTIPWLLSVLGGRVPLECNVPQYSKKAELGPIGLGSLRSTGVAVDRSIRTSGMVMLCTCVTYLVVEIPALTLINDDRITEVQHIRPFAWAGVVMCTLFFIAYIVLQYRIAKAQSRLATPELFEQRVTDVMVKSIQSGQLSLRGALAELATSAGAPASFRNGDAPLVSPSAEDAALTTKLRAVVRPFFKRLDTDGNGTLSRDEMRVLTMTLGENPTEKEVEEMFRTADTSGDHQISFDEFVVFCKRLLQHEQRTRRSARAHSADRASGGSLAEGGSRARTADARASAAGEDEDEEEVEMPEDIAALPPAEQRRRLLLRALWQMGVGTVIVLIFSDPMVDVLDAIGDRTGIPAFFVAFLLGPIASNASEMVASFKYAQKKSKKTISVSFSQLLGAACMNNTFCLLIFYLIVAVRGFPWIYHAEVVGIIFVEVVVGLLARRSTHTLLTGVLIFSLLPVSLAIVAVLKATVFHNVE
eukprot:TRINITY_DN5221_c0_g1_i2.p1 TRINITY_DN5221_c0_g1~~TRINITY_DN5221_c0_g1_i2.p1  ORF type:complete len:579 (-),score=118.13 TRINITY_DN5221_c0_g1_i2:170-1906(-)